MIKRINTLKRVGRFIELKSGQGTDHDFSQLNVVFASNASGKSTLCDVFRSMNTNEPAYVVGRTRLDAVEEPEIIVILDGPTPPKSVRFQGGLWANADLCPRIHVFDDRFVAENVLVGHHINVDQRRNLYGLVIGDKGIQLKDAVDAAEVGLTTATANARAAESVLRALVPDSLTIELFRAVPEIHDVDERITIAEEAVSSARQTKAMAEGIRRRSALRPITIPADPVALVEVLSSSLDQAALVAEERIRDHIQAHTTGLGLDWIGQGHRAQSGAACPHCGQDMSGLVILEAYRAFFSGELQEQERARDGVRTEVERSFGDEARAKICELLTSHETEQAWWSDAAGFAFELPAAPTADGILTAHQLAFQAFSSALDRKQANPATSTSLTPSEQEAISAWETVATLLAGYNNRLVVINDALEERKSAAGNIDLDPLHQTLASLEVCRTRHQQEVVAAFVEYDAAAVAHTAAKSAKQNANDALRIQANDLFARYGARINDLLGLFAANFRIVCGGKKGEKGKPDEYVSFSGGPPSGNLAIEILGKRIASTPDDASNPSRPSLANTLSGGDRSALALAFFLARVEQEPDLADSVVVFDDPFHSQDRSRQQRTIERIHDLARRARQCFVFSHDLDFAHAVSPIHGVTTKTFLLDPLSDHTILECRKLDCLPSKAYEVKYSLLQDFMSNPAAFSGQLPHVALTLRTILEDYLQLKYPRCWETGNDWFGTMIKKIREATGENPLVGCQGHVEGLSQINDYSQRFHHRSTGATGDIPDARELVTYVEQTLSVIHR